MGRAKWTGGRLVGPPAETKSPMEGKLEPELLSVKSAAAALPAERARSLLLPMPMVNVALAAAALIVWGLSLSKIELPQMNDLGLISVLPWQYFAAFFILLASFCSLLRAQQLHTPVLLLHIVCLILILYGTVSLVEEAPRLHVAWRHAGFVEYIARTGSLEHKVDAYFDWPVFFALSALMMKVAGWDSPIPLLPWAPVFFNLLYLGPMLMILRAATTDRRRIWLAIWIFYLALWTGYEFFAPQALNYFIFLATLGILFQWFRRPASAFGGADWRARAGKFFHWFGRLASAQDPGAWQTRVGRVMGRLVDWLIELSRRETPPIQAASTAGQRRGLLLIMLALFVAAVSSHMLTPFFIVAAVAALVVFNRVSLTGLPVIMLVVIGLWLSYMAVNFLSGHLDMVTEGLGDVSRNVDATVNERLRGSPDHVIVVGLRMHLSLTVWALALLGVVRRLVSGFVDLTFGLIGAVPFAFVALQAYGGEMMLRIYMFALPAVVFFAACLFYTRPRRKVSWLTEAVIGLLSVYLLGGFLIARYGNERMDFFTAREVEAVEYLYQEAPAGSLLTAISENLPWRSQGYETYTYFKLIDLGGVVIRENDLETVARVLRNKRYDNSYLIITRSHKAYADLFLGWAPGSVDRFEQALRESSDFEVIYENGDATIFIPTEIAAEAK